ncbi:MAG: hypothetical protein OXH53_04215 [bacterium]|nr:hypothetical protein [bacterium]
MHKNDIQCKPDKAAADSFKAGCETTWVLALVGVAAFAVVLVVGLTESAIDPQVESL